MGTHRENWTTLYHFTIVCELKGGKYWRKTSYLLLNELIYNIIPRHSWYLWCTTLSGSKPCSICYRYFPFFIWSHVWRHWSWRCFAGISYIHDKQQKCKKNITISLSNKILAFAYGNIFILLRMDIQWILFYSTKRIWKLLRTCRRRIICWKNRWLCLSIWVRSKMDSGFKWIELF